MSPEGIATLVLKETKREAFGLWITTKRARARVYFYVPTLRQLIGINMKVSRRD